MQKQRLEDLKYFKILLAADPKKGKTTIKLCRLLNKLAPNTLSLRIFHDMNCLEMSKNYPNGAYWSKASLFVVANNTELGQYVWDEIQKEPDDEGVQEATLPFIKELCESSEDFYEAPEKYRLHVACGLNSWVLQQIPMCPSMIYQWWLSSSYYLLKLEAYLADFYHIKFPKYLLKTVQTVVNLVEKARFYLNLGLQSLILTVKNGENFQTKHYEEIISAVSVVIYYYCQRVPRMFNSIMCLKRMCWSKSSAREVTIFPGLKKQRDLNKHKETPCKHEFVLPLWENLPSSVFMREQLVTCTGCTSCKATIQAQKLKDFKDAKKNYQRVPRKALHSFLCKVLIKKGRFSVDDQEALSRVASDPEIQNLYYKWLSSIGFAYNKTPLDEADKGPFFDVLVLTAELEQAYLLAAITQRLTTLSGIKSVAINCGGPEMTLEEIEKVFKDIELIPSWTFENSLKFSQNSMDKTRDNSKSNCVDYYTTILENSIKSDVLTMAQKSLKEDVVPDEMYKMRFMQHLLPCFVASFLDLKEDKQVFQRARDFYFTFIYLLLNKWDKGVHKDFYFKEKTVCFLKWKFESVCMELENYLYNVNLSPCTTTEKEQPPFITRTMKSNCFDVLTDFLGKTDDQTCFQNWRKELYFFSNSLQSSLYMLTQMPPGFSWKWGAELRAMSVLSRILATEVFKGCSFKDKTDYDHTNLLLGAVFKPYAKSEKSMMIRMMPGATKKNTWNDFQQKVEAESMKLSEQQRLALALYICLSSSGFKVIKDEESYLEGIVSTCDAVEKAYYQIKAGMHFDFHQTLSYWQRDEKGVNLAQVSYKYAMEVAPLCYSVVTCRLTKDMKIQMKEPGEITFCPVTRHCRWCGQVEIEQKELFVCQFCKDIPEYPDVNLFCSLDCEEKTLDKKHREEHAAIIKLQLEIGDVQPCKENSPVFPYYLKLQRPQMNVNLCEKTWTESRFYVNNSQGCCKCLNKEPKEEMYVVCSGRCKGKFHLQCTDVLDSDGVLKKDFFAATWRCDKCLPFFLYGQELSQPFHQMQRIEMKKSSIRK